MSKIINIKTKVYQWKGKTVPHKVIYVQMQVMHSLKNQMQWVHLDFTNG